jgi:hypothetical protein
VEGFGEGAHGRVGVLAIKEVNLLEGTTIGLYAGKASHFYDDGSDAGKLVGTGLVFARRLEHVAVQKAEFDFLFHGFSQCISILKVYVD